MIGEDNSRFEKRKEDHIKFSLSEKNQTRNLSHLDSLELIHEALPEINFEEVSLETSFFWNEKPSFSLQSSVPFFVSSMTAGHGSSQLINELLAGLSERRKILVGVGSQRKELWSTAAGDEWKTIRKKYPRALLGGNLGLTQLIELMQKSSDQWRGLIEALDPQVFFIHTNPLQEVIQPEGTPQFRGGLSALEQFCKKVDVPVVLKEVGCGFSESTLKKLQGVGLAAVDVAGVGGTHWGRLEGARLSTQDLGSRVSETFRDWGQSSVESVLNAKKSGFNRGIWASGGIRTGLDIAKMLALGADFVGLAQPWMVRLAQVNTLNSISLSSHLGSDQNHANLARIESELDQFYFQLVQELKVALFCTGSKNVQELKSGSKWMWSESWKK